MFTVATLNINNYADKFGAWPERRKLLASAFAQLPLDLAALQDVRRSNMIENNFDQAAQLARLLEINSVFLPATANGSIVTGCAFLARDEHPELDVLPLPAPPHAEDPTPRQIAHGVFEWSGKQLHLFNSHLSWIPEQNIMAARELMAFAAAYLDQFALILGDFNAEADSETITGIVSGGWIDLWNRLGKPAAGYTFESYSPSTRIDYIFASPPLLPYLRSIELIEKRDGGIAISDHLGLALRLEA